jgi:hypothetical protein
VAPSTHTRIRRMAVRARSSCGRTSSSKSLPDKILPLNLGLGLMALNFAEDTQPTALYVLSPLVRIVQEERSQG